MSNLRPARLISWLLALVLLGVSLGHAAQAKDKETADAAAPEAKVYRFVGHKPGNASGAQVMVLQVADVFTGKPLTLYVPNNDPAAKEYDPLTAVASAVEGLEKGAIIEVEAEKQKGRQTVTSLAKAELQPGEDRPNGFVFVESKEEKKNGVPSVIVTLKKFGREVKVGVPSRKKDYNNGQWEPDPKIDSVVRRLQTGMVVEALFRTGRVPMIAEIYEYYPPERGKFVGVKEVEFNNWPAAGFELMAEDGTTVTFTLEGTQTSRNGQTIYAPNPQQLRSIQKIKPDTELEVYYRLDGRTWMLRDIKVLGESPKSSKSGKSSKPAKDAKPEMKDGGPARN